MLTFTETSGNQLHYTVAGSLGTGDLRHYYSTVRFHYGKFGRLDLYVEVESFRGYASFGAVLLFLRYEPGLLRKVKSYTLRGGPGWLRGLVSGVGALIPWVRVKLIG